MKRKLITFAVITICFLLQSTIMKKISIGNICPNLLLIVTASFGFMRGTKSGMYVGLTCGLFIDLFWGGILGFHMLLFVMIGYFNGSFQRLFFDEDIKLPIGLIAISELSYGFSVYFFSYMLQGDFSFGTHLFQVIIPELVYTILVTLVLYQIILHINKKLETEEQRSASKFV
ncbi:MAG: rod shape-determining protein MreD [Dorea sp.]|jgi:rod shape-determining protein MreD|nr:rod shape-determining protein MreD [Dorea sp.]